MPTSDTLRAGRSENRLPTTIDNDTQLPTQRSKLVDFMPKPLERWIESEKLPAVDEKALTDANQAQDQDSEQPQNLSIDKRDSPPEALMQIRRIGYNDNELKLKTDLTLLGEYLDHLKATKSSQTQRAYLKELCRFYNWLRYQYESGEESLPLYRVTTGLMDRYIEFMRAPAPKPTSLENAPIPAEFTRWILPPKHRPGVIQDAAGNDIAVTLYSASRSPSRKSENWRPFRPRISKDETDYYYGLNAEGVSLALRTINSFFTYAIQENWLIRSPIRNTTFRPVAQTNKQTNALETSRPIKREVPQSIIKILFHEIGRVFRGDRGLELPSQYVREGETAVSYDKSLFARGAILIGLLYYQSLRTSEAIGVKTSDCGLSVHDDTWSMSVIGKGEKPREITLFREFVELWRNANEFAGEQRQKLGADGGGYLLLNTRPYEAKDEHGKPTGEIIEGYSYQWAKSELTKLLAFLCQDMPDSTQAQIKRITPHWLRHARARYLNHEYDPETIRILLGHTSLTTTQRYLGDDTEKALKSMGKYAAKDSDILE